jgi:transposase-like protein
MSEVIICEDWLEKYLITCLDCQKAVFFDKSKKAELEQNGFICPNCFKQFTVEFSD